MIARPAIPTTKRSRIGSPQPMSLFCDDDSNGYFPATHTPNIAFPLAHRDVDISRFLSLRRCFRHAPIADRSTSSADTVHTRCQ
jgi:hypothetical protein